MLRLVLLFFGWLIPILVMLGLAMQIYLVFTLSRSGVTPQTNIGLNIAMKITYSIEQLALSPLCFFGAFMIKRRGWT